MWEKWEEENGERANGKGKFNFDFDSFKYCFHFFIIIYPSL